MEFLMKILRTLSILVLASSLFAVSAPSMAADSTSAPGAWGHVHADWQAHHAEHEQARLDKLATLLQLSDAQKHGSAWSNYAKARQNLCSHMSAQHEEHADATALVQARADMAKQMAVKLSVLADATRALESSLSESQRKAFDEVVRQDERDFGHHGKMGFEHGSHE
jgi:hypothetical protein